MSVICLKFGFHFRTTEVLTSLEYKYPLLGRYNEIEFFKDLLDEIGLSERPYSGLVIEVFNENINLN